MFDRIFIEICGKCNAKCPWCANGSSTVKMDTGSFMSAEQFKKLIFSLMQKEMINDDTVIHLYNWGEPFLHPDIENIISILNENRIKFYISTNGSINKLFYNPGLFEHLTGFRFSTSGFSQKSYDRIHDFNFEDIKTNILEIAKNIQNCGFNGIPEISYLVYQFNRDEIYSANQFAIDNNIKLRASYAFFNSYEQYMSYINETMEYKQLLQASKELELFYINDLLDTKPENYLCPQTRMLTIDEYCNVLPCCVVTKNTENCVLGKLLEMSTNDVLNAKNSPSICYECDKAGINFLVHNPVDFKFFNN